MSFYNILTINQLKPNRYYNIVGKTTYNLYNKQFCLLNNEFAIFFDDVFSFLNYSTSDWSFYNTDKTIQQIINYNNFICLVLYKKNIYESGIHSVICNFLDDDYF